MKTTKRDGKHELDEAQLRRVRGGDDRDLPPVIYSPPPDEDFKPPTRPTGG
jgi:hypothetical protein